MGKTPDIEAVIRDNKHRWMSIVGVEGVGQGLFDERPCIKLYLSAPISDLPSMVDGFQVVIDLCGEIHKQ